MLKIASKEKWVSASWLIAGYFAIVSFDTFVLDAPIVFLSVLLAVTLYMWFWEWPTLKTENWDSVSWVSAGAVYFLLPMASVFYITLFAGMHVTTWLIVVAILSDFVANLSGKLWGRFTPKLAEHISPKKSWAGAIGSFVVVSVLGFIGASAWIDLASAWWKVGLLVIVLAILAQSGDLFESFLKRQAGVKDVSNLLPGHGGLMDRVDSFTFTAPAFAWYLAWTVM